MQGARHGSVVRRVPFVLAALAACGPAVPTSNGAPCLLPTRARTQPLLIGDTFPLRIGRMQNTDCMPTEPLPARWRTTDSAVVRIDSVGVLSGLAPGVFTVHARIDSVELTHAGFVFPKGWKAILTPDSQTVSVGDTAWFEIFAVDDAGRRLPPVSYAIRPDSFHPAEPGRLTPTEAPLHRLNEPDAHGRAGFIARRGGVGRVWARIGLQERAARLHIITPDSLPSVRTSP